MFIIYDLIFLIFSLIYLPIYLLRRKFHKGFLSRLGFLPRGPLPDRPIWIHAVSVGEAMAIRPLIEGLRKSSDKNFVISTVTPTGNKIVRGLAGKGDLVTYLPLDLSFIVKRVIDRINPALFIIAETEIWPNLISYLRSKDIPVIIVNARISDASFKGYLSIKFLLQPILKKVSLFCAQTERDAQRLSCLGAARDKIRITGNMKFDIKPPADFSAGQEKKDYADYRLGLQLAPQDRLWVAGSTHPGEEELILAAYKELRIDFPNLKLVIAPRHPQRCWDVAGIASRFGLHGVFLSSLASSCPGCAANSVFILDTIGRLVSCYAIAEIVFVGGSLVKKGGHNILEPAFFARPILFGPHMFNFRDIADLFLGRQAAIKVNNAQELKANMRYLLNNPEKAAALGKLAEELIIENQGATKRNAEYIRKIIVSG